MPLADTAIKNARPGAKPVKLSDEKGLFLLLPWARRITAPSFSRNAER